MFKGSSQHDTSELITFLLDGLNEDLNRIIEKPYIEGIEGDGMENFDVAKKSWLNYQSRNNSIITELMYG